MEQEPRPLVRKLVEVAAHDFPGASKVGVSFPEQWEYIETIRSANSLIYVAGFPIERAFTGREYFEGLPPEINVNLVFFRLYKFFQPWPMPQVTVEWSANQERGRVTDIKGFKLQLQSVGQAQAWFGLAHAVLWEAYFDESYRVAHWQETLADVWGVVEKDLDVPKIFTAPQEPVFPEGYREFLTRMGYTEDVEHPLWWSKQKETRACATVGADSSRSGPGVW